MRVDQDKLSYYNQSGRVIQALTLYTIDICVNITVWKLKIQGSKSSQSRTLTGQMCVPFGTIFCSKTFGWPERMHLGLKFISLQTPKS